jgi:hypothetical protein
MPSLAALFPKWVNRLPLLLVLFGGGGAFAAVGFVWYYFSPRYTDVGYQPAQPVLYSHKLHAGTLGMDCRYCHFTVEKSTFAAVPPSQVCMNCHTQIRKDSPKLGLVRESFANGTPVQWIQIHKLPDFVHFNHSVHINAGVGCFSCHGRIDQMEVVHQAEPLSMSWCLNCHREPERHLRPKDKITKMDYYESLGKDERQREAKQLEIGRRLKRERNIHPPENCSACHY